MDWLSVEAPDPDRAGGLRTRQPHRWALAGTVMAFLLVAVACFGVGEAMGRKASVEEGAAASTILSDADPTSKFAVAFVPSPITLQRANTNMNPVNGQVFAASTITMAHHVEKKATKHHEHSRPRKSRASDRDRAPTNYPAHPDIPWMTVTGTDGTWDSSHPLWFTGTAATPIGIQSENPLETSGTGEAMGAADTGAAATGTAATEDDLVTPPVMV